MFLHNWVQVKLLDILEEIFWTGLSAALWCMASILLVAFCIVLVALEDSGCPRREEIVKIHQIDGRKVV